MFSGAAQSKYVCQTQLGDDQRPLIQNAIWRTYFRFAGSIRHIEYATQFLTYSESSAESREFLYNLLTLPRRSPSVSANRTF